MTARPVEVAGVWIVPEVHDPATGRIDAKKLARALGVKQSELAQALQIDPRSLSRKPTLPKIQERARLLERAFALLIHLLGSEEVARAWLQAPNPNLGGRTAWEVCRDPEAYPKGLETVVRMLERVVEGIPS